MLFFVLESKDYAFRPNYKMTGYKTTISYTRLQEEVGEKGKLFLLTAKQLPG
jgi:hypothetical protein